MPWVSFDADNYRAKTESEGDVRLRDQNISKILQYLSIGASLQRYENLLYLEYRNNEHGGNHDTT